MRALLIVLGLSALVLTAALAGPRLWADPATAPEATATAAGSSEPPAEAPAPADATQPTTGGCDSCTLRHERIRKLKEARDAEAAQEAD
jgi:hypothetical protein